MMRLLYFDLETCRSADEVGGWERSMDMGMSCGVIYDSSTAQHHVYLEDQTDALSDHLRRGDIIVGFNHVRFDLRVLAGHKACPVDLESEAADARRQRDQASHQRYIELHEGLNHFDMLKELEQRLGHRLRLESIARATLGEGKSASGLDALRWYREGRMDLIVEYCKRDVDVTRAIHEYALRHGKLLYESRSGLREVILDWRLHTPKPPPSAEQISLF